jgi:RND superfamily putative drug exporter
MISGMGLALGIDYSLFVVSRYREERLRGREPLDAIAASGATASRAVLFSGTVFVIALVGMLLVPDSVLRSLALGAILVGIVSVLAALTLMPALLGLLGDRINSLRLPIVGRTIGESGREGRFWGAIVHAVMRRPVISLIVPTALLIAVAIPILSLKIGHNGISTVPDRFVAKQGYLALARNFPRGRTDPVLVVVQGKIRSPDLQAALTRLRGELRQDSAFGPSAQLVDRTGTVAIVGAPPRGDAEGKAAADAVRRLRGDLIPRAFAGTDARVLVGGTTAQDVDYFDTIRNWLPIVLGFVLGLSFVLLTIVFRSLIVAVKAIFLNLLSVGAAYGLLVLVFQKGYLASFFGFQQVDTIEAWVPLFLFSVLFGLSMDYHVFLLTRIRERFLETGDNDEAVAFGIGSTARLITGAALIIVAVFCGFAKGDLVMFQQMGFGVAVALLLDATIIRSVVLPAAMKLLGSGNWYLPRWLGWLPELHIERA